MTELWRGNANAWECDELGHMNVQFYMAKASEAVATLARLAGLGGVFREDTNATLVPRRIHIKYLAEAHPGAPLVIHGGFTGRTETSAEACLVMSHGDGDRVAATFRMQLDHVSPREGRVFAWPRRFHEACETLTVETPDIARPRGLEEVAPSGTASIRQADKLGLQQIGIGAFTPAEIGPFGRIRPDVLLGRVSNSVIHFANAFPEEIAFHAGELEQRIGSALLETVILPQRWPRAGDSYVIRSGLKGLSGKVRNLVHWVLDPQTGLPWWTTEGVAAPMDLDARKLIDPTPEMRARLEAASVDGLSV